MKKEDELEEIRKQRDIGLSLVKLIAKMTEDIEPKIMVKYAEVNDNIHEIVDIGTSDIGNGNADKQQILEILTDLENQTSEFLKNIKG